jgi:hypothetical protein
MKFETKSYYEPIEIISSMGLRSISEPKIKITYAVVFLFCVLLSILGYLGLTEMHPF